MFAYFIGGPWDLTKRAMKPDSPQFYVPQLQRQKAFESGPSTQVVPVTKHEYRKMFTEDEAMIYIYQGVR